MSAELGVQVPGQAYLFSQPIEMRFNEILEGHSCRHRRKVFGDDYAEIERSRASPGDPRKGPGAADVEFDALARRRCSKSPQIARQWPNTMFMRTKSTSRRKRDGWR